MFLRNVIIRLQDCMVLPRRRIQSERYSVVQTSVVNKQWIPEMREISRHMFTGQERRKQSSTQSQGFQALRSCAVSIYWLLYEVDRRETEALREEMPRT